MFKHENVLHYNKVKWNGNRSLGRKKIKFLT